MSVCALGFDFSGYVSALVWFDLKGGRGAGLGLLC